MQGLVFLVSVLFLIGVMISSIVNKQNEQLKQDIAHMKQTVDNIAKQMGVPDSINDELKEFLLELISEGETIKAIKEYRMATGAGLVEGKQYIDQLSEQTE
ncbi:hypothetical protein [Carnobacterium pleistocenium]|uniref:hypothetical protein n=1 Tax=Carnobacterium pleistocenium TaxID=181073 RepID=UPI00068F5959|nr:hypothetical protein [Carnobacterium pleistocenium]